MKFGRMEKEENWFDLYKKKRLKFDGMSKVN
jgi:hypothetical protein